MDVRTLANKRIARHKFGEKCKIELEEYIKALPTKELKTDNPNRDTIEILVYHDDNGEVRSHDVAAIGLDTDDTLIFTDKYGDAFDETELVYTAEVYPYILEIVLGQYC